MSFSPVITQSYPDEQTLHSLKVKQLREMFQEEANCDFFEHRPVSFSQTKRDIAIDMWVIIADVRRSRRNSGFRSRSGSRSPSRSWSPAPSSGNRHHSDDIRGGGASRSSDSPHSPVGTNVLRPSLAQSPVGPSPFGNNLHRNLEDAMLTTGETFDRDRSDTLRLLDQPRVRDLLVVPACSLLGGVMTVTKFTEQHVRDSQVSLLVYEVDATRVVTSRDRRSSSTLHLTVIYKGRTAGEMSVQRSSQPYNVSRDPGVEQSLRFEYESNDRPRFLAFSSNKAKAFLRSLPPSGNNSSRRDREDRDGEHRQRQRHRSRSRDRDNTRRPSESNGDHRDSRDGRSHSSRNRNNFQQGESTTNHHVSFSDMTSSGISSTDYLSGAGNSPSGYPFVGPLVPPATIAATDTKKNPFFTVIAERMDASNTNYRFLQDPVQGVEFPLINVLKTSSQESAENLRKLEETSTTRRLINPAMIVYLLTGKGLDLRSREQVVTYFTQLHMQPTSVTFGPPGTWDQREVFIRLFSSLRSCRLLNNDDLFEDHMKYGTRLDSSSDWKISDSKNNTRITDFLPAETTFDADSNCSSRADLLSLKSQLACVLRFVEHGHVLLRHPYVFLDSFSICAEALQNQNHQVCKDIFTVPCLVWFFEILLGQFFRTVHYLKGMYSAKGLRALLFDLVVFPFTRIGESEATRYSVLNLQANHTPLPKKGTKSQKNTKNDAPDPSMSTTNRIMEDLTSTSTSTTPTRASNNVNTSRQMVIPRSGSIAPKSVCKYWLCSYLQVPFTATTNVPQCTYQTSDGVCPVHPHQDFDNFSKEDFLQLLGTCRHEFMNSNAPWPQMYEVVADKIMAHN